MTLRDIGKYKNKLFSTIIQSEDIAELILGKNYNREYVDELLIYKHVFPYLYVDDTQTQQCSYVCVEVDVPRTVDFTYKDMKIIVWCYCHRGIMKYSKSGYLGIRSDILADMVDRLLNSSTNFGIGRLKLQSASYLVPNKEYYGKQLIYTCSEFNIDSKL